MTVDIALWLVLCLFVGLIILVGLLLICYVAAQIFICAIQKIIEKKDKKEKKENNYEK